MIVISLAKFREFFISENKKCNAEAFPMYQRFFWHWNYYYLLARLLCTSFGLVYVLYLVREVNSLCPTSILLADVLCTQTQTYASNAIHTRYCGQLCVFHAEFIRRNTCSFIRLFFVVSFILSFVRLTASQQRS